MSFDAAFVAHALACRADIRVGMPVTMPHVETNLDAAR